MARISHGIKDDCGFSSYEAWEDSGRAARPEMVTCWVVTVPELSELISIVQAVNAVNPQKHPDAVRCTPRPKPSQPFLEGSIRVASFLNITLVSAKLLCIFHRFVVRDLGPDRIKLPTGAATLQQLDNVACFGAMGRKPDLSSQQTFSNDQQDATFYAVHGGTGANR
ncbi:uncharacterized protein EI90DRAFT_3026183 [Cantharellus anzutake]|uniref:uncharacterized protein n=1 Tax=Cantharellus anzutake TaxID=1750568 RepID=UPI0019030CC5|nr:uncharacterized protein EI90DRAFT_3026183 [Cantharellus anzutake]KAF8308239.1 hypothetical protein EI90DRAFT_3026183 [Cantharellus anzutake]